MSLATTPSADPINVDFHLCTHSRTDRTHWRIGVGKLWILKSRRMSMQMVCVCANEFRVCQTKAQNAVGFAHCATHSHTINGNRSAKRIIKIDSWADGIFRATNFDQNFAERARSPNIWWNELAHGVGEGAMMCRTRELAHYCGKWC